ncbi:TPA: head completion/stabilization protein [Proteus mirabilis]|nr:head completion/stabilization protein [Proteus mirabilis]ELB1228581.1 head completion/stabilization protein [Proteus mirabilis]ELI8898877.1 head completion/stabilization protein [Proteus mirabilis]ELT8917713.1 head completion/stabilization protein [Proteus mirabilis]MBI6369413.1 head completion/stabilization protein [Proteus mirabilis]MCI9737264.1 head completion/stabilization protein [Proteus mirabilis]
MDYVSASPVPQKDETIKNNGFFPDIQTRDFQLQTRVDGAVTPERLKSTLLNAMIEVNRELYQWRIGQAAKTLKDVPAEQINGESELMILYQRAVFCFAKASLIERYRDIDTTAQGNKKADTMTPVIDEVWRDGKWALQRIKGETHNTVELI